MVIDDFQSQPIPIIRNWQLCGFPDRDLGRFRMCLIEKPFEKFLQDQYAKIWFVERDARGGVVEMALVPDLATADGVVVEPMSEVDDGLLPLELAIDHWFNRVPDMSLMMWLALSPQGGEAMKANEISRLEREAKSLDGVGKFKLHMLPYEEGGPNVPHIKITDLWRVIAFDQNAPRETLWTRKALGNLLRGFDRWHLYQEESAKRRELDKQGFRTEKIPPATARTNEFAAEVSAKGSFKGDGRVSLPNAVEELIKVSGGPSKLSHVAAGQRIRRAIKKGKIKAVQLNNRRWRIERASLSAYLYNIQQPEKPDLLDDVD